MLHILSIITIHILRRHVPVPIYGIPYTQYTLHSAQYSTHMLKHVQHVQCVLHA